MPPRSGVVFLELLCSYNNIQMAQSPLTRFYQELKRRKVIRVAVVYGVVAWLIVEVASVMFPGLLLPEWSVRLVIALAIVGFPIALVLAWALELTPEGVRSQLLWKSRSKNLQMSLIRALLRSSWVSMSSWRAAFGVQTTGSGLPHS